MTRNRKRPLRAELSINAVRAEISPPGRADRAPDRSSDPVAGLADQLRALGVDADGCRALGMLAVSGLLHPVDAMAVAMQSARGLPIELPGSLYPRPGSGSGQVRATPYREEG